LILQRLSHVDCRHVQRNFLQRRRRLRLIEAIPKGHLLVPHVLPSSETASEAEFIIFIIIIGSRNFRNGDLLVPSPSLPLPFPPHFTLSTVPNLSALRSAARGDLVLPRTRLQLGNRAFSVAGPVAWNSLPLDIRSSPTLSTFKLMLKTHLFSRSYFSDLLFPDYEQRTLCRALVVTLAMLLRIINCRYYYYYFFSAPPSLSPLN